MSDDLTALVKASESQFRLVAPKWFSVERLTHLMLSATSRNPALLECTKESFLGFCMKCAETGMEPIGAGGAWAVPFKNKYTGKREVTFIPDWRGLIQLAKRTEQITHAFGDVICEKDQVDYQKGDTPQLIHKPALSNRGQVIGAYCICTLPNGAKHIEYMDKAEIDAIKARSKAKDEGPWVTDWAQMAIKTVVKRALKVFATSPQMQTAIEYDNAAVGLALPADRPPVAMPQELPPHDEKPKTDEKPQADKKQEAKTEAKADTEKPLLITGVPEKVSEKAGEKNGKSYVKYGIKFGDKWIGTFDDKIGQLAQDAVKNGQEIRVEYVIDGKWLNAVKVSIVSDTEEPKKQAEGAEELPFEK